MTAPTILYVRRPDLPKIPTYIGRCCREWVLATFMTGRCGICGEVPTYLRPDPLSPDLTAPTD